MLHLWGRLTAENAPLSSAKITILCLKFKGFQLKLFEQIKNQIALLEVKIHSASRAYFILKVVVYSFFS